MTASGAIETDPALKELGWEILRTLPVEFAVKTPDGIIVFANDCWLKARDVAATEVVGKREEDLCSTRFVPGWEWKTEMNRDPSRASGMEWRQAPSDELPELRRASWMVRDGSEQTWQACLGCNLSENERPFTNYREAIEASQHGLWYRDLLTDNMFLSPQWWEIVGRKSVVVGDQRADFLERVHEDDRIRIESEIQRHLAGATKAFDCEFRVWHEDGTIRWMLSSGRVVVDREGHPIAIAGSYEDVTDRKATEQFYLRLINAFPGNVWVKNERFEFVFINERLAQVYGTTCEKAIGKTESAFNMDTSQVAKYQKDDLQVLTSREPLLRSENLSGADGKTHYLETVKLLVPPIAPWKDQGDLTIGFSLDLTELRQTKEELEITRGTLKTLMDSMEDDAIFFKDRDYRFLQANNALAFLSGHRSGDDLVGKKDSDLFDDPVYLRTALSDDENLFVTGNTVRRVMPTPTLNGVRHRLVTKVPVRNADGSIVQLCGISKDVTDLIDAQENLRARTEELDQIFNALPVFAYVKDQALRYVRCNQNFAERHNQVSPDLVIGKSDFDYWDPVQAARFREEDRWVLDHDLPKEFNEIQQLPDGRQCHLETVKIPLHDGNGVATRVLGIFQDVTERVENQKLDFNKKVAQSISHCLKNWMNVISGTISTLRACHETLSRDRDFARLECAVVFLTHATKLATQITALQKSRRFADLDLMAAVQSVVNAVGDDRIVLVPCEPAPATCRVLEGHVTNAILEVIANALAFSPSLESGGRIEIHVKLRPHEACTIHVDDNGPGVPGSLRDKIFDFFMAGDPSRTGMGLGYARWVCEECNGSIRLEGDSRLGGAHFVMSFPLLGV